MTPIIDSHIHLFRADHLPHLAWATPENPLYAANLIPDYLSGIPTSERANFKGFVFVETDRCHTLPPDNADKTALKKAWEWPLEEFDFVFNLSRNHPDGKYVLGIVPWGPMNLGVHAMQTFYMMLQNHDDWRMRLEMLKGFRYLVQDKPTGTIGEVNFRESMGWVWKMGLACEIGVDVRSGGLWQLEEATRAIQEVVKSAESSQGVGSFVINHLCKPNLQIPPSQISSHPAFQTWKSNIEKLAALHPSIVMKVSGIFAELPQDEAFANLPASEKEDQIISRVMPWVSVVLRTFGPDRVIWGSDWPVCKTGFEKIYPSGEYSAWEAWRKLADKLMKQLSEDEIRIEKLFWKNSLRVYNLKIASH